jgi:hypothetical protein
MGQVTHTRKTRALVIEAYRQTARVDTACRQVGINKATFYRWLAKYPEYKAEFESASEEVAGIIEDEIKRRALEGVLEPVFHAGKRAMDFARDEKGELIRQACKPCKGTGAGPAGPCPTCQGTGKSDQFVAVPAAKRVFSDACILALAAARVPGFSQKLNHRFVDDKGKDRTMGVQAVRDYMESDSDQE